MSSSASLYSSSFSVIPRASNPCRRLDQRPHRCSYLRRIVCFFFAHPIEPHKEPDLGLAQLVNASPTILTPQIMATVTLSSCGFCFGVVTHDDDPLAQRSGAVRVQAGFAPRK